MEKVTKIGYINSGPLKKNLIVWNKKDAIRTKRRQRKQRPIWGNQMEVALKKVL